MKMKRIFIILVSFLLVFGCSACGSNSSSENKIPNGSYRGRPDSDEIRNEVLTASNDKIRHTFYPYEYWYDPRDGQGEWILWNLYDESYSYLIDENGTEIILTNNDEETFIGNIEILSYGFIISGTETELDRTWTK